MTDRTDNHRTGLQPRAAKALYSTLLSQIFEGTLTPGTRLPTELELVGIYGASRAIVRSALQRLKNDKLVVSRQGGGNYVAGLTHAGSYVFEFSNDVSEYHVLEIRRELERTATWHAADQVDLGQLRAIHEEFKRAADQSDVDIIRLRRLDIEFHLAISRASSNPILSDIVDIFSRSSAQAWIAFRSYPPSVQRSLAQHSLLEHDLILKAIEQGNRELASLAMHRHIQTAEQRLEKLPHSEQAHETMAAGHSTSRSPTVFENPLEQAAYLELFDGILDGTLRGGSRLPREQDLANRYKISRPAVRKVLQALKHDYLVYSKQGSAHYVAGHSKSDTTVLRIPESTEFAAVFEMRMLLECLACQHAASCADSDALQKLEDAHRRLASCAQSDYVDLLNGRRADIDFHTTIASCSPNPILRGLIDFLMPSLAPNFSRWSALSESQKRELASSTLTDHDVIISAIRAKQPELARFAMQQHFERTTKKYRAFVWINN